MSTPAAGRGVESRDDAGIKLQLRARAPLGLLGGTFDPVHNAHLRIARHALDALGLEEMLWLPTGHPPYRSAPVAPAEARLAMLEAALAGEPHCVIDTREFSSSASGYTVDTLRSLRQDYGEERAIALLMGSDQFSRLAEWHQWQELFKLAHLAIVARPGWAVEGVGAVRDEWMKRGCSPGENWADRPAGTIVRLAFDPMPVSASEIRARVAAGAPIEDCVPRAVRDYIVHTKLYSKPRGARTS